MEKYGLLTKVCICFVIIGAMAITSAAQTFTNLSTFITPTVPAERGAGASY